MSKIEFSTPYKAAYITRYIEPSPKKNENEFITNYVIKSRDSEISIETKRKRKKFKSKLIEK